MDTTTAAPAPPDDRDWYVLQTKPRMEDAVRARARLLGIETFLPRMYECGRAGGRVQRQAVPLFPTYLFARVDFAREGIGVRYVPGVRDFVRSAGRPQAVGEALVTALRERMGPQGVYDPPARRFQPGERLSIEEGPLRGVQVVFERELSGVDRVAVLLAEVSWAARVVLPPRFLASA